MAWLGLAEEGDILAKEGKKILARLNDLPGLFFANHSLTLTAYYLDDIMEEQEAAENMLQIARELDDQWFLALALTLSGLVYFRRKDSKKAKELAEESLRLIDAIQDQIIAVITLNTLGHIAIASEELTTAEGYFQRCLNISEALGFPWAFGNATKYLGQVALLKGELAEAETYFLHSLKIADDLGLDRDIVNHLFEFARLREAQDRAADAVLLLALLMEQPASRQARLGEGPIRDSAQGLLDELEAGIPAESYIGLLEQGRQLELDEMLAELRMER